MSKMQTAGIITGIIIVFLGIYFPEGWHYIGNIIGEIISFLFFGFINLTRFIIGKL